MLLEDEGNFLINTGKSYCWMTHFKKSQSFKLQGIIKRGRKWEFIRPHNQRHCKRFGAQVWLWYKQSAIVTVLSTVQDSLSF